MSFKGTIIYSLANSSKTQVGKRVIYLGILLVINTITNALCNYSLFSYGVQGKNGEITSKVHNLLISFIVLCVLFLIFSHILLSVPFLLVCFRTLNETTVMWLMHELNLLFHLFRLHISLDISVDTSRNLAEWWEKWATRKFVAWDLQLENLSGCRRIVTTWMRRLN